MKQIACLAVALSVLCTISLATETSREMTRVLVTLSDEKKPFNHTSSNCAEEGRLVLGGRSVVTFLCKTKELAKRLHAEIASRFPFHRVSVEEAAKPEAFLLRSSSVVAGSIPSLPSYYPPSATVTTLSNSSLPLVLWDSGLYGQGISVALIDTGVDTNSCWFKDPDTAPAVATFDTTATPPTTSPAASAARKVTRIVSTYGTTATDTTDSAGTAQDELLGHGTRVAGAIAGLPYEVFAATAALKTCLAATAATAPRDCVAAGVTAQSVVSAYESTLRGTADARATHRDVSIGVAPGARLQVVDSFIGTATTSPVTLQHRLFAAAASASKIIALTLGATPAASSYGSTGTTIDSFLYSSQGFLVVVPTGNSGRSGAGVLSDIATSKNALSVGSTSANVVPTFSSFGPTAFGMQSPDIVAPGYQQWVPLAGQTNPCSLTSQLASGSSSGFGTSIAAGNVAGAAAIIYQYLLSGFHYQSSTASVFSAVPGHLLKAFLIAGSTELGDGVKCESTTGVGAVTGNCHSGVADTKQGFGQLGIAKVLPLNLTTAANRAYAPIRTWTNHGDGSTTTNSITSSAGAKFCFNLVTRKLSSFKVVLTWYDTAASSSLVADLDLLVVHESGASWRGNEDITTATSTTGRSYDNVNTVEVVNLHSALRGKYNVFVKVGGQGSSRGTIDSTLSGSIPYSLVVVGGLDTTGTTELVQDSGFCHTVCPENCNALFTDGSLSSSTCSATTGECTCTAPYEGPDCSQLTGALDTTTCNSKGVLVSTACQCVHDKFRGYYAGSTCNACPSSGGTWGTSCLFSSTTCAVNGGTSSGTTCTCAAEATSTVGVWAGAGCNQCASNSTVAWAGPSCKCADAACSGHGVCGSSGCTCSGNWGGTVDIRSGITISCSTCKTGFAGDDCQCAVDANGVCGGHGTCTAEGCICDYTANVTGSRGGFYDCSSKLASGRCLTCTTCATNWHRADANSLCLCHQPAGGALCSGHGTCGASGCVCSASIADGFWRTKTVGVTDGCGHCAVGYIGPGGSDTSACKCGVDSSQTPNVVCSGRGNCTSSGCSCIQNSAVGHWSGASCSTCATNYYGPGFSTTEGCKCYSNDSSTVCNGHGECESAAGCACYGSLQLGFWTTTGSDTNPCDACQSGFYGPDSTTTSSCKCQKNTAGLCSGKGTCGTDGCVCDASVSTGFWGPTEAKMNIKLKTGQRLYGNCDGCAEGYVPSGYCTCSQADAKTALTSGQNSTCAGTSVVFTTGVTTQKLNGACTSVPVTSAGPLCATALTVPSNSLEVNMDVFGSAVSDSDIDSLDSASIPGYQYLGVQFQLTFTNTSGTSLDGSGGRSRFADSAAFISVASSQGCSYEDSADVQSFSPSCWCPSGSLVFKSPITINSVSRIGNLVSKNVDLFRSGASFSSSDIIKEIVSGSEKLYAMYKPLGAPKTIWTPIDVASCSTQRASLANGQIAVPICCIPPPASSSGNQWTYRLALMGEVYTGPSLWETRIPYMVGAVLGVLIVASLIFLIFFCGMKYWARSEKMSAATEAFAKYLSGRKSKDTLRNRLDVHSRSEITPQFCLSLLYASAQRSTRVVTSSGLQNNCQPVNWGFSDQEMEILCAVRRVKTQCGFDYLNSSCSPEQKQSLEKLVQQLKNERDALKARCGGK